MVAEVRVNWSMESGGGRLSTFYFDVEAPNPSLHRADVNNFLQQVIQGLTNSVSYTIDSEVRHLDTQTGTLIGAFTGATAYSGVGNVAQEQVPDAAQLLLRWGTGGIVNGRRVRGRTFIPGLPSSSVVNGNLKPDSVTGFGTMADSFQSTAASFCIWHRPKNGAGGSAHLVTSGSAWSEIAVLRRRR